MSKEENESKLLSGTINIVISIAILAGFSMAYAYTETQSDTAQQSNNFPDGSVLFLSLFFLTPVLMLAILYFSQGLSKLIQYWTEGARTREVSGMGN